MFYLIKHTLLVCMGILCLLGTVITIGNPTYSMVENQRIGDPDDIIITVIGFDILIESAQGDAIILAADLYDSNQQIVRSERKTAPVQSIVLNTNGLPSGYYVLQVLSVYGMESFQLSL